MLDATGQADLVARGDIQPSELLALAVAAADAAEIGNAIPIRFDDEARATLRSRPAGPFAGVPFLLKDYGQEYRGQPNTLGSRAFRHQTATQHSAFTRRCLEAGLVVFGRTATPELALRAVTEPRLWGPSRNPWDRRRTPGGSSGGAAAAVAAGLVAMAGASDGGGSIRIPASFCGLFGLKPSAGLVSAAPFRATVWDGASTDGVLTRSVRDCARMLDVLVGPEPGDPFVPIRAAPSFAAEVGAPPGRLRIGFSTRSPIGAPVHPSCVRAVHQAATLLQGLGHQVEEAEPAIDGHQLAAAYLTLYLGQVAAATAGASASDFELETSFLAMLGRALPAGRYVASRRVWNDFARALGAFHQSYDLYMTPTVAAPPSFIGEQDAPPGQRALVATLLALRLGGLVLKTDLLDRLARESLARTPFTQVANLTGTPAMSVPLSIDDADGPSLPVGVQFIGRYGADAILIRLAAQLEEAAPWAHRRAPKVRETGA